MGLIPNKHDLASAWRQLPQEPGPGLCIAHQKKKKCILKT
jgi:hypothetical protein